MQKLLGRLEALVLIFVVAFIGCGGFYAYHKVVDGMAEVSRTNVMVQSMIVKGNSKTSLTKLVHDKFPCLSIEEQIRLTEIIYNLCEIRNVPINLIMGLGEDESGFNPKAVSSCGAKGWLQVLPGTARPYIRSEKLNYSETCLFDPVTCAIVSINLIADMHEGHMEAGQEKPGDFTVTLHSYLWGLASTAQLYGKTDKRTNVPNMAYPMRVLDFAKKYKEIGL
jgi:hypothetical protein